MLDPDEFFKSVLLKPTPGTIADFLSDNVKAYFTMPKLLEPNMGVEFMTKKKSKKKAEIAAILTPVQRAVKDYGGHWAVEQDGAGERMFYYWASPPWAEVRMAFFMADKCFRVVQDE